MDRQAAIQHMEAYCRNRLSRRMPFLGPALDDGKIDWHVGNLLDVLTILTKLSDLSRQPHFVALACIGDVAIDGGQLSTAAGFLQALAGDRYTVLHGGPLMSREAPYPFIVAQEAWRYHAARQEVSGDVQPGLDDSDADGQGD